MFSGSSTTRVDHPVDQLDVDAAGVLASARRARATAQAAEAQLLADAVDWAHLHTVEDPEDAAT